MIIDKNKKSCKYFIPTLIIIILNSSKKWAS